MKVPSPVVLAGAASLALWGLLGCLEVQIACNRTYLMMAIDVTGWQPDANLLAAVLAASLFVVAAIRGQDSLPRFVGLLWLLCLLRLASLWQPIGTLAPFLSMLWSPHASWALAASLGVLVVRGPDTAVGLLARQSLTGRRLALMVFAGASVLYGCWALYLCQLTMVHGDEAHYLLATQSLLRDGDIDLHNNDTAEGMAEFRHLPFDLHRAPSSPPGTSYSIHPPGLSVLLLPAYASGLALWQNPRLACYLFMALLSAAVLGLLLLWLLRLGYSHSLALMSVGITGTTAPMVFFSVQLYPDMAAIGITVLVLVLLAHWQIPGSARVSLCRHETLALVALTAALGALPFLHPRFLPLALGLGLLVVQQARTSPSRRRDVVAVVLTTCACAGYLLMHNLAVSGDWLGHMRPGNAWDDRALTLSTWSASLPGHWLHATKGLIASAPVMLLCLVGGGRLLQQRDWRLVVALVLYGATVAVNGAHHDWTFGFAMPARFMTSGIPALCLLLCAGLAVMLRRSSTTFVAMLLLIMSWDTLVPALTLPAMAYDGMHLALADMGRFYPLMAHLMPADDMVLHLADALLWGAVAFALVALGHGLSRWRWRAVVVLITAAAPALWGQSGLAAERLQGVSPYMVAMSEVDREQRDVAVQHTFGLKSYQSTTGQFVDGLWRAEPSTDAPGLLASYYLPLQQPGVHEVSVDDYFVRNGDGPPDHIVFTRRRTLPAVQPWESRRYLPVARADGVFRRPYIAQQQRMGYLYFPYTARRAMSIGAVHSSFHALPVRTQLRTFASLSPGTDSAAVELDLPRGRYRARFRFEGNVLASLLQSRPEPMLTAVFVAPLDEAESLQRDGDRWLREDRTLLSVFADPFSTRPETERLQAPWWIHIAGSDDAYDLEFSVPEKRRARLLWRYAAPLDLRLADVTVFEEQILP